MSKKLLICDDDIDIVEMLEMIFEDSGIEIVTVTDSRLAFQIILETQPDLLLMDLWMPVITGDQILSKIRDDKNMSSLPVIIMSAAPEGKKIAADAGANEFIAKPFDIDQLFCVVQNNFRIDG